mmetsp:Transcript_6228/g.11076  ORF Transcript_6228/g.11076 Transcript_6228/m.11076 type:complete len:90 (-) Transcript_6228:45-314(-)
MIRSSFFLIGRIYIISNSHPIDFVMKFQCVQSVVEKKSVRISGFGSFLLSERKPRNIFNIGTKAMTRLPASNNMRFRPSKIVKNNLNRK